MRGLDTSRLLKIRSDQRYKQCLISVIIIELPRNAANETQNLCRLGDNRLNMAQKGHSSVPNDPKVLNFLDMFKFNTVVKPNGFLLSIKINRLAFCSVQAELSS
jgi:hypothetical protein